MMHNVEKNNEVAAQLFPVVIVFSWLVLAGFHDCHQIHMNHPFSLQWMTVENGWLDGFHGNLDVLFLLIYSLKVATFLDLFATCAATCDEYLHELQHQILELRPRFLAYDVNCFISTR